MIRDVGLGAVGDTPLSVMAANLGKVGSNQNGGWDDAGGRDLPRWGLACTGVLPPAAPPIASATMTGLAFAAWRQNLTDSTSHASGRDHHQVANFGNH